MTMLGHGTWWTPAHALAAFPSLVGHAIYGAILGRQVGTFAERVPQPATVRVPGAQGGSR